MTSLLHNYNLCTTDDLQYNFFVLLMTYMTSSTYSPKVINYAVMAQQAGILLLTIPSPLSLTLNAWFRPVGIACL